MTGYTIYVHKNSDQTNGSIYEQFDFRKILNKVRVWCGLCNRDPGVAVRRKSPESLICCVYLAVHYVTPRTCRDPVNSIPSDTSRSCFSPTSLFFTFRSSNPCCIIQCFCLTWDYRPIALNWVDFEISRFGLFSLGVGFI